MPRRWPQWTVLVIATSMAAVGAEFVFRAVVRARREAALQAFEHPWFERTERPFSYWLRPNLAMTVRFPRPDGTAHEWRFTTNADRCRGPAATTSSPGARRVLFLGDSYTFGVGVDDDQTCAARMEAMLRDRGVEAVAINAGVPGFNTVQESRYLPELLDRFEPSLVVLGFVMNDADAPTYVPIAPQERFARCRSWLWTTCVPAANALARWIVSDRPVFSRCDVRRFAGPYRHDSAAWQACRAALGAIRDECAKRDVALLIAVLTAVSGPVDDTYPLTCTHEKVVEWGAELGVEVVDLLPVYRGRDARSLALPDGHPNALGQALIAEALVAPVRNALQ